MIYLLLTWLAAPVLWWRASRRRLGESGRILVIQTAKIGDFVSTTPVFRALRNRLPGTEIVVLLHQVNVPLAEGLDSIDRIITLPMQGFKGWAGKRWLLGILAEGYDGVLILSPNLTNLLVPFWAGVPQRVSVLADRRQGSTRLAWPFLTHGEPHVTGRPFRETALRALAGLDIAIDAELLELPGELARPVSACTLASELLGETSRPRIGLGVGAGNRLKALTDGQLAELARGLVAQTSATLVLTGTADDQPTALALIASLPAGRVIDTTGRCPLGDLPALLGELDVFVGVDSGATYIADAVGTPVVDFMGPADADDQCPGGVQAIVLRSSEPCAPCSHAFDAPYRCHLGTRVCIARAPLGDIVRAVVSRLVQ